MNFTAYWRLARFDKPVGILLLWFPTAWALWTANQGKPSLSLVVLFFVGTVLMRAAGCVINDIADRDIDKQVKRTQARPLTAGEVSLNQAIALLFVLLLGALLVLVNLPRACFYWAIPALAITVIYPFCKRFIRAPQLVLGLAFSMGIPMAYAASHAPFDRAFLLLFLANAAWIVAYDTMYAMADREDDLKIPIFSTAIYFGRHDRLIIGLLQLFLHSLWLILGVIQEATWLFYGLWIVGLFILIYQQHLIRQRLATECFKAFLVSSYYGAIMWAAVILIK